MTFKVNYQPVVPKSSIYHRSGWKKVIDSLRLLHDEKARVKFIDLVENYYLSPKAEFINCPWIGIMHYVPGVPLNEGPSIEKLLYDKRFKRDLFYCKGLYTLSEYLKIYLIQQPILCKLPIVNVLHPTDLDVPQFSMEKFEKNRCQKLLFIGNQDRRLDRFLNLETDYSKFWLSGKDTVNINNKGNITLLKVTDEEYDLMLQENLVMVDLYNSSANNTILECIARSTPIFVNMVGGTTEYLGQDYPLFFHDQSELEYKLKNQEMIEKAHIYLSSMDKSRFSFAYFLESIGCKVDSERNTPVILNKEKLDSFLETDGLEKPSVRQIGDEITVQVDIPQSEITNCLSPLEKKRQFNPIISRVLKTNWEYQNNTTNLNKVKNMVTPYISKKHLTINNKHVKTKTMIDTVGKTIIETKPISKTTISSTTTTIRPKIHKPAKVSIMVPGEDKRIRACNTWIDNFLPKKQKI